MRYLEKESSQTLSYYRSSLINVQTLILNSKHHLSCSSTFLMQDSTPCTILFTILISVCIYKECVNVCALYLLCCQNTFSLTYCCYIVTKFCMHLNKIFKKPVETMSLSCKSTMTERQPQIISIHHGSDIVEDHVV